MKNQTLSFEHDGHTYEVVIPNLHFRKKNYTAAEIVEDETMRAQLVEHAWNNAAEEPRTEETFNENGILKLVYSAE